MNSLFLVGRGLSRLIAAAAGITATVLLAFGLSACGGGGGSTASTATPTALALPGVPTSFTVSGTSGQTLSATLNWSVPTSGATPTSYEIYRSTTAGTAYSATNHLISIPVVAGQGSYSFLDNAGLAGVDTYWVVSAKNASGETPTAEVTYKPIGSPSGGDSSFGNNASVPIIFADGIGLGEVAITGTWSSDVASVDYNTGLRPLTGILPSTATALPYLNGTDTYVLDGVTYYKQGTSSTWQAEWANGAGTKQHVVATWGDNLSSQKLTSTSTIRVEIGLNETLPSGTTMLGYNMKSLYGTNLDEVQGTDGTTYDSTTAAVFAANAHLRIDKLDGSGGVAYTAYDGTLWGGDGPGNVAGEVTVSGGFTYGYVLQMKNLTLPTGVTADGTWRITFSLDTTSPAGTSNNTVIDSATNGVLDNPQQVHIDINVAA